MGQKQAILSVKAMLDAFLEAACKILRNPSANKFNKPKHSNFLPKLLEVPPKSFFLCFPSSLFFSVLFPQSQCLCRCNPLRCEAVAGTWSWSWGRERSCCLEFQEGPERSLHPFHAEGGSCWALLQWCGDLQSHCTSSLRVPRGTGVFSILGLVWEDLSFVHWQIV